MQSEFLWRYLLRLRFLLHGEPAFNSIVIPVNPEEPYKSSIYIIQDIETIGFNDNYMFRTNHSESKI